MPELSPTRIAAAPALIDPTFLNTPLVRDTAVDRLLGSSLALKVETDNPIGCFKGRGTSLFVARDSQAGGTIVAASAGNFGQGLAHAGRRHGQPVVIYAAERANARKVTAMRALGAEVVLHGADFDAAKEAAKRFAAQGGGRFVEDGAEPAIAEGAGTIAVEILAAMRDLDALYVPLGNGALATGVGCWVKHASPRTRVVAVAAEGAPCMKLSYDRHQPVATSLVDTIADGIAVRVPVPFAVACMPATVDEVMLVADDEIVGAMRFAHRHLGRIVEPAGAAGLAGILKRADALRGRTIATILCGANLTPEQIARWLPDAGLPEAAT
jgi:threonine dehydratase